MAHVPVPVILNSGDTVDTPPTNIRPIAPIRWVANSGYAILLVVMALIPPTTAFAAFSVPDWIAHAGAYGIQSGLLYWAMMPAFGSRGALAGGILGAVGFGLVTEGLQLLQPGRSVELRDVVANTAGAVVVCGIIAAVSIHASRRVG